MPKCHYLDVQRQRSRRWREKRRDGFQPWHAASGTWRSHVRNYAPPSVHWSRACYDRQLPCLRRIYLRGKNETKKGLGGKKDGEIKWNGRRKRFETDALTFYPSSGFWLAKYFRLLNHSRAERRIFSSSVRKENFVKAGFELFAFCEEKVVLWSIDDKDNNLNNLTNCDKGKAADFQGRVEQPVNRSMEWPAHPVQVIYTVQ